MPIYASLKKASYTIEAAVIMPLFISLMVLGIFTFRILQVEYGVQHSIDNACRTMAVTIGEDAHYEGGLLAATIAMSAAEIVKNDVPIEFIDGGAAGFYLIDSSAEGNYIDIKVKYSMSFPIGLLGNFSFDVSQRAKNRKWVGYDKNEYKTDGNYVYITEKGEAYHSNYYCTYLNPSVHRIPSSEVSDKRNKSGGIYYQCKRCKGVKDNGFLYITDYGTSFHSDVNCTEIKHNIKKVLLEEVKDTMRPCSKCSGN
jgi:hypothetical protein